MTKNALSLTQEFRDQCGEICTRYQELRDMNLLPMEMSNGTILTPEQLKQWEEDLEKQTFIIAVCGQIKAGKSTLLNALLFEKDLIPEADTPLTATITIIRHATGSECFDVEYYSREEWNRIQGDIQKSKEQLAKVRGNAEDTREITDLRKRVEDFEAEVAAMRKKGVVPESLLGKTETIHELSRARLEEFVTPVTGVEATGRYTPLVKQVTLHTKREELKGVTIVDTPGTNDANAARSARTLNWIKQAHAVIFLTYAGRPFDAKDIEFIDKNLTHVPQELLVVGVNKADVVEEDGEGEGKGINSLEKLFINTVVRNTDIGKRKVFTEETARAYVSALAERLRQKENNGDPLSEDDEYYLNAIKEKLGDEYFDFLHEQFEKFRETLKEKLFESAGSAVIESHAKRAESVLEDAVRKVRDDCENKKALIEEIKKDPNGLKRKAQDLENAMCDLENLQHNNKKELERKSDECLTSIDEHFITMESDLRNTLSGLINGASDLSYFKGALVWDIKNALKDAGHKIQKMIKGSLQDLEDKYSDIIMEMEDYLRNMLGDAFSGSAGIKASCNIAVREHFKGFADAAQALNNDLFQQLHEKHKKTFLWLIEYGKADTLKNCKADAFKMLDGLFEELKTPQQDIRDAVSNSKSALMTKIENIFKRYLRERKDAFDSVVCDLNKGKQARAELEKDLRELEKRLAELRPKLNEFVAWRKQLTYRSYKGSNA